MMGKLKFFLYLLIKQTSKSIYSSGQVSEGLVEEIQHGRHKGNEDTNASNQVPGARHKNLRKWMEPKTKQ